VQISPPRGEWDLRFTDEFSRDEQIPPVGTSGTAWGAYSGPAGGNRWARWSPDNVVVGDGNLVLKTTQEGDRYITGGVGNDVEQKYGKWEVTLKMPYSPLVKFVLLLWPAEGWPPEVDFGEGGGKNGFPDGYSAYSHWGTAAQQQPGNKLQTADTLRGLDMNDWHTIGVQWRPNIIDYTIDGQIWATVTNQAVPDQKMWLAIQTEATGPAAAGDPTPPDLLVDRVQIWSWNPVAAGK
jgi:beta-glucanase (GH16 family)